VVDIGCGVGDVSLLAARLVGRHGRVTSVRQLIRLRLKTLTARASSEGIKNIECVQADIHEWRSGRKFDAVVGRHILIHSKIPLTILRDCAALLHDRGLAVLS
jgi:2-polyprenyl-3-methyl-5-hydroxy-6-metoxy-1,4-benzoquinol methylase